jgi:hypothetical protein
MLIGEQMTLPLSVVSGGVLKEQALNIENVM